MGLCLSTFCRKSTSGHSTDGARWRERGWKVEHARGTARLTDRGLARARWQISPPSPILVRISHTRLGPENQTNIKPGSARGTASPAPLTTPVKPKRVGSGERKRIKRAKAACNLICTPGAVKTEHTAEECPELKARADAKADADTQVKSLAVTLASRSGTPSNWEWDQIITDDNLC
eukprot:1160428-Rhodomonas_salina.2